MDIRQKLRTKKKNVLLAVENKTVQEKSFRLEKTFAPKEKCG